MATQLASTPDAPAGPRDLADWLIARGRHWVTSEEVAVLLGIPQAHVSPALCRWRRRGYLFSPTEGAYVPIPPEYRSWGAVPASGVAPAAGRAYRAQPTPLYSHGPRRCPVDECWNVVVNG